MSDSSEKIGVLLMAYGGPDSLDDIEAYLLDIRGGRPTSPQLVAEIRERYAKIGGKSPLLDITTRQAAALETALGAGYKAYVGMRHWQPHIADTIAQMEADGIRRAVAIVAAPHYSAMSVGAYFDKVKEAASSAEFTMVNHWHDQPKFIEVLSGRTSEALSRFSQPDAVKVMFTAHSLPTRILEQGDPYPDQLNTTARLVAEQINLSDWGFCFQSAGRSPEPWLGPAIEDVIPELAAQGYKNLLVVPVGFVSDHVEVLYDIDIECRQLAQEHGMHLERTNSLNDDSLFIAALADVVRRQEATS